MLRLENIDKSFLRGTANEKEVFRNFQLEIAEGEFVSIIGSNGSGKTTLLNLISGNDLPDQGRIFLDDQEVTGQRDFVRYRQMGRVFQDTLAGISPSMTLFENLSMADNKGKAWNLSWGLNRKRRKAYQDLLAPLGLGLEEKMDQPVQNFSGGQRQAVALIMAGMQPIRFLLLDEHTAALDPKTADKIMELTDQMVREKGLTALMVTHNLRYALEYGSRLLMLHEGKILLDKSGKEKAALAMDDLLDQFYAISIEAGNSI